MFEFFETSLTLIFPNLMNWKQINIYKQKINCDVETICDVVCPDVLWRQTGRRTVSEWKKSLDCKILLLTLSRRLKYLRTLMRKQYLLTLSDQKLVACAALLSSEMSHDSVWHSLNSIGWQNLNLLSHPNETLALQVRQATASGENLNYTTLAPNARPSVKFWTTCWVTSLTSWYHWLSSNFKVLIQLDTLAPHPHN